MKIEWHMPYLALRQLTALVREQQVFSREGYDTARMHQNRQAAIETARKASKFGIILGMAFDGDELEERLLFWKSFKGRLDLNGFC